MGYRVPDAKKWPNGIIPYRFVLPSGQTLKDANVDLVPQLQQVIVACMRRWESFVNTGGVTYIQFVENDDGANNNVKFINLYSSSTGGVAGGLGYAVGNTSSSYLSIKWPKKEWFCIPHELGHVLGLAHENNRNSQLASCQPYVTGAVPQLCVDMSNASASFTWDNVALTQKTYIAFGSYDVNSIMHYPAGGAWVWNCGNNQIATILSSLGLSLNYPSGEQVAEGAWRPSAGDILTLQNMYAPAQTQSQT